MAAAPAAAVLLLSSTTTTHALSLFGFGSSGNTAAEDAKARAAAVALIKENAAADEFVPPAVGVGRRDAARFAAARAGAKLVCSGDSSEQVEISWDRVNDDFCDCPGDGSDEPGTSACSNGAFSIGAALGAMLCPVPSGWSRRTKTALEELRRKCRGNVWHAHVC